MSTLCVVGGDHAVLADYRTFQERRNLRVATITNRAWALAAFIRHIAPRALLDATEDDVQSWLDSRVLSAKSRACDISTLHCFFEFCQRQGLVAVDPTVNVVKPRLRRTLPRPMSTKDINRAMVYASPLLVVDHGKGGHQRVLPLNRQVQTALSTYGLPRQGYLWVGQRGPIQAATVTRYVSRYLHGLGIQATAHQGRHYFASTVYHHTKDLRLVQELLGHSHPSTTAVYTAWSPSSAASVVRDLGLT